MGTAWPVSPTWECSSRILPLLCAAGNARTKWSGLALLSVSFELFGFLDSQLKVE